MALTGAQVDAWIAATRPGSPLVGLGDTIVSVAQQYGVSVPLILGIMLQESQLGADGSALPAVNNFSGLTGTGWPGQTGVTSGMARQFATFATPADGVRAAILNLSRGYAGLSLPQVVAKWLTGDPNGTADERGNSAAAYLATVEGVYRDLGQPLPAGTPVAGGGGGTVPPMPGGTVPGLAPVGLSNPLDALAPLWAALTDRGTQVRIILVLVGLALAVGGAVLALSAPAGAALGALT